MRIPALIPLLFVPALVFAAPPELRRNEITRIDPVAKIVTVGVDPADVKSYRCTGATHIVINDKPADFSDLTPGMMAIVTATAPGIAARVAAVKPLIQPAARPITPLIQRQVTVPATAVARNPVPMWNLRGGQVVRITPVAKVRWTSGGAKAGAFCDWAGFADDHIHGLPRMILVAAVGDAIFVPSGETFTFTVVHDGGFVLFVNDDDPAGNEGSAEVTVSVSWK